MTYDVLNLITTIANRMRVPISFNFWERFWKFIEAILVPVLVGILIGLGCFITWIIGGLD